MKRKLLGVLAIGLFFVLAGGVSALPTNVALQGTASQSSTHLINGASPDLFAAYRAIDDITAPEALVAITCWSCYPWWEVDLLQEYLIDEIEIWPRTDSSCTAYRLIPSTLSVLNENRDITWSTNISSLPSDIYAPLTFLPPDITGQFVRINLNGCNYLELAEVQVFSDTTPVSEPATMFLLGTGLTGFGLYRKKRKSF
ncbi:MAG: PEP-CTERM sorting domain-containing protein [Deltaproteobacteria bacterium]|nr:PEP-CTERM sorting domain-containing protein [Deltaproteobacteria bacterium]